jgi:Chromosome segregation ATPases
MRHLYGGAFTFAVLDDVLMSIDAGHRREVCALMKREFPNTQFVVTTHDPIWLRHMKTEASSVPVRRSSFVAGMSMKGRLPGTTAMCGKKSMMTLPTTTSDLPPACCGTILNIYLVSCATGCVHLWNIEAMPAIS